MKMLVKKIVIPLIFRRQLEMGIDPTSVIFGLGSMIRPTILKSCTCKASTQAVISFLGKS